MYETPPLLTIKRPSRRPTDAQIAAFQGVPSAIASDAMDGRGALVGTIRRLFSDRASPRSVTGPALTAWSGAADLLALHACKEFITPGDIVMAGVDGHQGCAVLGDSFGGMMRNAGAAAVVTDGPVRDLDGLGEVGLPIWCTGATPATPYENGPGRIGLPMQLGGQEVESGDMIVADLDGVVVVPFEEIDTVAARAAKILEIEADGEQAIKDGLITPESIKDLLKGDRIKWVD